MRVLFDLYDSIGGLSIENSDITVGYDTARYAVDSVSVDDGEVSLRMPASKLAPPDHYTLLIRASVTTNISSGTSRSQCKIHLESDTGSGFSDVPGTFCYTYNRNSGSGFGSAVIMTTFHINKSLLIPIKFRVRAVRISGSSTITTVAEASNFIGIQDT